MPDQPFVDEEGGAMTAGTLAVFLSCLPPDTPVVYRQYHAHATDLGPGEYDWYGGLPTGEYKPMVRPDLVCWQDKVIIDPPMPRE